jgi:hypothetical protein
MPSAIAASVPLARAAAFLNDASQAIYTNTVLLPYIQTAWDELAEIFEENNITLHWMTHEGMVLPNNIMDEVASFYLKYDFINLSTYKNYPIEEIFVSSYLYSKYNLKNFNTFSFRYNYDNNYKKKKYTQIYNDTLKKPLILSLKPVARKNEDPLRILIRQNNY